MKLPPPMAVVDFEYEYEKKKTKKRPADCAAGRFDVAMDLHGLGYHVGLSVLAGEELVGFFVAHELFRLRIEFERPL